MKACEQSGITVYVPKPNTSSNLKRGLFTKEDFIYEPREGLLPVSCGKRAELSLQTVWNRVGRCASIEI